MSVTDARGEAAIEGLGVGLHVYAADADGYAPVDADQPNPIDASSRHLRIRFAPLFVAAAEVVGGDVITRCALGPSGTTFPSPISRSALADAREDTCKRFPNAFVQVAFAESPEKLGPVVFEHYVGGVGWITTEVPMVMLAEFRAPVPINATPVPGRGEWGRLCVQLETPSGRSLAAFDRCSVHGVVDGRRVYASLDNRGEARLPAGRYSIALREEAILRTASDPSPSVVVSAGHTTESRIHLALELYPCRVRIKATDGGSWLNASFSASYRTLVLNHVLRNGADGLFWLPEAEFEYRASSVGLGEVHSTFRVAANTDTQTIEIELGDR